MYFISEDTYHIHTLRVGHSHSLTQCIAKKYDACSSEGAHDHFFRPRNPLPKDENQAISPNKPDTQTAGPRDDGDDDENRGGRIVSLGVTAMRSVVSTISRRVSLVATRISRGKHQMPPFPTTAVLLIAAGIHYVGLVLDMIATGH